MYKVTLPIPISEKRYGILFTKGKGSTDNKDIADKLKAMGYHVESFFNAPIEMPVEEIIEEVVEEIPEIPIAPPKPKSRKKASDV